MYARPFRLFFVLHRFLSLSPHHCFTFLPSPLFLTFLIFLLYLAHPFHLRPFVLHPSSFPLSCRLLCCFIHSRYSPYLFFSSSLVAIRSKDLFPSPSSSHLPLIFNHVLPHLGCLSCPLFHLFFPLAFWIYISGLPLRAPQGGTGHSWGLIPVNVFQCASQGTQVVDSSLFESRVWRRSCCRHHR